MTRFLKILAILFVVTGIAFLTWIYEYFNTDGPLKAEITVIVEQGIKLKQITALLNKAKIIQCPRIFTWIARLSEADRSIKAGEYKFVAGVSPRNVLKTLTTGKTVVRKITIPEGLSSFEITRLIDNTQALQGTTPIAQEGTLLPESYNYSYNDKRSNIIKRMSNEMLKTLSSLWEKRAESLPYKSPRQALILASIIEKETSIAAERTRIASVFINRLRKGMKLQSDPTVIYGITRGQRRLGRPLTRNDLKNDSPYNTYRIKNLPPGPICNPGKAAIAAVLKPATTNDLYFVANGSGGHAFAETLAEHNINVARWRKLQRPKLN